MENYKNSKAGRETAQKYGDILEMERPQTEESLRKHPRMTLQNQTNVTSVRLFNKTDEKNKAMANIPFKITSKTTGESHIVNTASDGCLRLPLKAVQFPENM